jgi:hypothetical protein
MDQRHLDCNLLQASRQVGPTNLEQNCLCPTKQLGRVASPILAKESVMRGEEKLRLSNQTQLGRVTSPILAKESVMRGEEELTDCQIKPSWGE